MPTAEPVSQNHDEGRSIGLLGATGVGVGAIVGDAVVECSAGVDLVLLGLRRLSRRNKTFGVIPVRVARETQGAVLMISRRG